LPLPSVSTQTAVFLSFGRKREKVGGKKRESLRTAKEKTPSASTTRKSGVLFRLILQIDPAHIAAERPLRYWQSVGDSCRRSFYVQPDNLTRHAHHSAVEAAATWPHPPSRFHVVPLPLRSRRDGTLPRGEGKLGFGLAAALAVARLPCLTVRADR
jgi:hypothetical protein